MFRYFFCLLLLFLPQVSFADVRLAVLEFRGVGIGDDLLQLLTDEIRTGVLRVSKGQKIKGEKLIIMTRENMMQVLKDQGLSAEDCVGECEVEIAKNIGADYVISGNLSKIDTIFALVVKLHSTADSNLLASESFKTKSKESLITDSEKVGAKVFQEGLNLSASSSGAERSNFSSSGRNFGSGVQMNVQEKLKQKKCRRFAEEEGLRQRERKISQEAKKIQAEATAAWNAMYSDLQVCLELDLEDREPCQEALNGWLQAASDVDVVLSSGMEEVQTACGMVEEVFPELKRSVSIVEYEEGKILQAKLRKRKPSVDRRVPSTGYASLLIPAGSFVMGCISGDSGCKANEKPRHKVTLTRSFYMMRSEVTQGLYERVMGSNPSKFAYCGNDCPVETVSWLDAVTMANKLSKEEGLEACYRIIGNKVTWPNKDCNGWRLPTEAEWEYAARGGEKYKYAGSNTVDDVAWHKVNSSAQTHKVCEKQTNGYGLCDMSGNVWEWVWDLYGEYKSASLTNPMGKRTGLGRVGRGGAWANAAMSMRVSRRHQDSASYRGGYLGFRLVRFN